MTATKFIIHWKSDSFWQRKLIEHPEIMTQIMLLWYVEE